jgi:hypothetical protein
MLDNDNATFIQTGVSISLASCGPDRLPTMSRGLGCKVFDDGRQVGIFLRRSQSEALLENIRTSGRVANVFSLPSSNRTVQLKGNDARVMSFSIDDLPIIEGHVADFVLEVIPLGMTEPVVRVLLAYQPEDLVTVVYTPSAAFSQTPGPKAGERLD